MLVGLPGETVIRVHLPILCTFDHRVFPDKTLIKIKIPQYACRLTGGDSYQGASTNSMYFRSQGVSGQNLIEYKNQRIYRLAKI